MITLLGDPIFDKKVNSQNYLLEMTLQDYYELTIDILKNNEFQRNKVNSSGTIYSRLREDLKIGCVMPSIVLALPSEEIIDLKNKNIIEILKKNQRKLIILDGLQRTFTIQDVVKDCENQPELSQCLTTTTVRVELYYDISKYDVLYRMLTLNTGHTQMSIRHQIEIVYSDLLGSTPNGIIIYKDTEKKEGNKISEYKYSDAIDGFTSLVENDYLPIERTDILAIVKNLSSFAAQNKKDRDLFNEFIFAYDSLVRNIYEQSSHWNIEENCKQNTYFVSNPYGKSVPHLFGKPQTIAGFGAAIGKLINLEEIKSFDDVTSIVNTICFDNITEDLDEINKKMEFISKHAKKIGNDQRFFFYCFFLILFTSDDEVNHNFSLAIKKAFNKYERETF